MLERHPLHPSGRRRFPLYTLGTLILALGVCLLVVSQAQPAPLVNPENEIGREESPLRPAIERTPVANEEESPLFDELGGTQVDLLVVGFTPPQPDDSTPEAAVKVSPTPGSEVAEPTEASGEEPTPSEEASVRRLPPATRLVISALGIDAPVVEVPITNKTWDVSGLTYEIAHLGGTANPGERNNMVLAGHVTLRRGAGPFLHLESLEPGDMAIVYAGEQAYTYRVVSKRYVGPTDVSVAHPTSDPILTLITCTDWDAENRTYTQRVAVIAELVEEERPSLVE